MASRRKTMSEKAMIFAILILNVATQCYGQIGGNCACTPSIYEWTLNFSATCSDIFLQSQGIEDVNCRIEPFQPGVTDLTPVEAVIIDVTEFNQLNQAMQQTVLDGEFIDGDSFVHISATANPVNITANTIPKSLQITIVALNRLGQPLSMVWITSFTNNCNLYPVFTEGETIAWTIFSNLTEPDPLLCPRQQGTAAPTRGPAAVSPTTAPTRRPPGAPTRTPTRHPTRAPSTTALPTWSPTIPCSPIPSKGKGKGWVKSKGKGSFYVPKFDYLKDEYDFAYKDLKLKSGKKLKQQSTKGGEMPKNPKSEKLPKSAKVSKSSSKGKGIFQHPTPSPSSVWCKHRPVLPPHHHHHHHHHHHPKPTPGSNDGLSRPSQPNESGQLPMQSALALLANSSSKKGMVSMSAEESTWNYEAQTQPEEDANDSWFRSNRNRSILLGSLGAGTLIIWIVIAATTMNRIFKSWNDGKMEDNDNDNDDTSFVSEKGNSTQNRKQSDGGNDM